jgi:ribosomal protein S18 acetylase RimI-like enzyme
MVAHRAELLRPGDEARADAFLAQHAASSMFLRSNLRRAGLVDRGARFEGTWVGLSVEGELVAVGAIFWSGILQLQAPRFPAELARRLMAASPRPLRGIIGPWLQVVAAREALGLGGARCTMESREDLFTLPLDELVTPGALAAGRVSVRAGRREDVPLLTRWGVDYDVELKCAPPGAELEADNRTSTEAFVAAGEQFVLEAGRIPVATCTWNARMPEAVQIGGVYTPPSLRGRGYARSVVAGALRLAREGGADRAVLFTGVQNRPAHRAYEAIGFRRVGDFGILLFAGAHGP